MPLFRSQGSRIVIASLAAVAQGLFNVATGRRGAKVAPLSPGDEAPDFELLASDGQTYRFSDFRGRQVVIVAWFPKAFTGGCTAECASIGSSRERIDRFDVAYFGANVDTPDTNREFAGSLGLEFPILSDPTKTVARAFGVIGPSGFPARSTFYIGLDGRIFAIDRHVRVSTHGLDIEKTLERFNVTRRHS